MTSFDSLRGILEARPLTTWPGGGRTPPNERIRSPFSAPWTGTLELLQRELRMLDAERAVLELVGIRESDIRKDGLPRASLRLDDPGLVLSFDSSHGALRYAVDRFRTWEENLRAIALGLEALRKVDRYGVASRGEQYRGWRALPAPSGSSNGATDMTSGDALALLSRLSGMRMEEIETDPVARKNAIRIARFEAHPDRGGTEELWLQVTHAVTLIDR